MKATRLVSGFTLIELLVVIAVIAVATDIGLVMFGKIADAWRRTSHLTELDERANAVFGRMRRDFGEIVNIEAFGGRLEGVAAVAEADAFFRVPLEDDRVTFPVVLPIGPEERQTRVDVVYAIDRTGSVPGLVRTLESPEGAPLLTELLAEGVLGLRVEYSSRDAGASWQTGWTREDLPKSVRIGVVLMHPVDMDEQISRKVVIPINVN